MKVAIIHYWLVGMRGGEKVVESLCRLFPDADIYTHVIRPKNISSTITNHKIYTTFISKMLFSSKYYQKYLLFMPYALEKLNLNDYDLIISSESGPAKGVITSPNTLHICYCHSPMRYLWNMYHEYYDHSGFLSRTIMNIFFKSLRQWDYIAAQRVDKFIANSKNVQKRIEKYYQRDSEVIYPPVNTNKFKLSEKKSDFYFILSELIPYKKINVAIRAFNKLEKTLVIAGKGSEEKRLRKIANNNIKFIGRISDKEAAKFYSESRAFIFPGEEDFGITPLESMASGTPVIAYAKGGALETIIEGKTGLFFYDQSAESIINSVLKFEKMYDVFDPITIRNHAKKFDVLIFEKKISQFINKNYNQYINIK